MISSKELEHLNREMVELSSPSEEDGIGYNKADYEFGKGLYYGLSFRQLADLSRKLKKYSGSQLRFTVEELDEAETYFEETAKNEKSGLPVTLLIGSKTTAVSFRYNDNFATQVKKIPTYRYVEGKKVWVVFNSDLYYLLYLLDLQGANTDNARLYAESQNIIKKEVHIKENASSIYLFPDDRIKAIIDREFPLLFNGKCYECSGEELAKIASIVTAMGYRGLEKFIVTKKINVVELNQVYVALTFDKDSEVLTAVQRLYAKEYDNETKRWHIPKVEIEQLIKNLKGVPVDVSELRTYMPLPKKPIKLKESIYKGTGITPFPHQIEAAEFLLTNKKALLADEQGTGKTISSIMASLQIKGKKLVVCPATLKLNWEAEILMLDPNAEIVVVNGANWKTCKGWTIINYDILTKHIESIEKAKFKVGIFDEVHYCRGIDNKGEPSSTRAKMFIRTTNTLPNTFLLTGTPILNKVKDIFNLLKAAEHPIAFNFFSFGHRYCGPRNKGFGWEFEGKSNEKELHEKIQPIMIRRLKKDVLDLPDKIRHFIKCPVNLEPYYQRVKEYMEQRKYLKDDMAKLVELTKLRYELAMEKLKYAFIYTDRALAKGLQVVIFTNYRDVINAIVEHYGDIATKIDGSCSGKARRQAVVDFQAGNKKVIACNYEAAGVGVTLTASSVTIKVDLAWLPALHLQSEDRTHRIGQTVNPHIIYLYTEAAIEKIVVNSLKRKLDAISVIMDGEEADIFNEVVDEINAALEEETENLFAPVKN